jgi:hypothetical protein
LTEGSYPRTTDMDEMARRAAPDTLAFFRYWDSKRQRADGTRRRMPRRADIDPIEMKPFLPFIQLLDVVPDAATQPGQPLGQRLIYRLVGEMEIKVRGYNPTGRTVAEAAISPDLSDPLGNYAIVVEQRIPLYDWSNIPHPAGYLLSQESLLLPLSDDEDERVTHVLTYGKVISTLHQTARPHKE